STGSTGPGILDQLPASLSSRSARASGAISIEPAYPPLGETPDRIQADPSWEFHELRTGHDSMLMAPEALADLLDKLAGS
ncbi:MAG: hypothetical protein ACKORA_03000, partial [Solirubrobacterales bacterium]